MFDADTGTDNSEGIDIEIQFSSTAEAAVSSFLNSFYLNGIFKNFGFFLVDSG